MNKFSISVVLITALVFSCLPCGFAAAEETDLKATTKIFEENFETSTSAITCSDILGILNNGYTDTDGRTFSTIGNDIEDFNGWKSDDSSSKNPNSSTDSANSSQYKAAVVKVVKDGENHAGSFMNMNTANNAVYCVNKTLLNSTTISKGKVVFSFRVQPLKGAGMLYMTLSGTKATTPPNMYFNYSNNRADIFGVSTGNNGLSWSEGNWTEYEIRIDFDNSTIDLFENGTCIKSGANQQLVSVSSVAIGLHRTSGASAAGGGFLVDDVNVYKLEPMAAKITPTEDGELNKANLVLNNPATEQSVDNTNVVVEVGGRQVTADSVIDSEEGYYEVTFPEKLEPETEYNVKISGFEDKYGQVIDETIKYKTRAKRVNREVKFYENYGISGQSEIFLPQNGDVTVEVNIENETSEPFSGDVIAVYKNGDEVVKAAAADGSAGAESKKTVTVMLPVTGITIDNKEECKIEVYVWDSITGMKTLFPMEYINVDKDREYGYANKTTEDDIGINLAIDSAKKSATISGSLSGENSAEVSFLLLKPTFNLNNLTYSNFNDAVMCIGQKSSKENGSYTFTCNSLPFVNGNKYTAVVAANGKTNSDASQFFDMTVVNKAIETVNDSVAEELVKLFNKSTALDSGAGIYLNDVLQIDMSVYNKLEKPLEVCKELALKKNYTGIPEIREAFAKATETRRIKEDRIGVLLDNINNALWSEIEDILLTDKNGINDLELTWSSNYDKVCRNSDAKVLFYKHLASNYKFKTLDELQAAFTSEPQAVLNEISSPKKEPSSSGGGGKATATFKNGFAASELPKPLQKDNEKGEISFDDLKSVPWAEEYIISLVELGVLQGMGNGRFEPNAYVTREQFIKMIVCALGYYDENAQVKQFIDISEDHWSNKYVASAINKGIVYGIDEDHFGVGQRLTRAEMAVILHRAAACSDISLPEAAENTYADNSEIPDYAKNSVSVVSALGYMSGVGDNHFSPRDYSTRAMAAKVICLLRGGIVK